MHVCIIGGGASGLMAANFFANTNYTSKITLIKSKDIPTVGVGESTTLSFLLHYIYDLGGCLERLIREADATVKLGVMYKNWGLKNKVFLNLFRGKGDEIYQIIKKAKSFEKTSGLYCDIFSRLGNKNKSTFIHNIIGKEVFFNAIKNNIHSSLLNFDKQEEVPGFSWHFDAGLFINLLIKMFKEKEKTYFIEDTVIDCLYNDKDEIEQIILKSGEIIKADFFIISSGRNPTTEKIFNLKYKSLDSNLLTDKALFLPIQYTNKKEQLTPFTIAKTMKYGWRWITPTWSRIGTGYVFSSRHINEGEAIDELRNDMNLKDINPRVIDFSPRMSEQHMGKNYCVLGLSAGFLEPLDAPGLAISIVTTKILNDYFLTNKDFIINKHYNVCNIKKFNNLCVSNYEAWEMFIFSQYNTCHRDDTKFWKDYKQIKFKKYDDLKDNFTVKPKGLNIEFLESNDYQTRCKFYEQGLHNEISSMIKFTLASRNIQFNSHTKCSLKTNSNLFSTKNYTNHFDFLDKFHKI